MWHAFQQYPVEKANQFTSRRPVRETEVSGYLHMIGSGSDGKHIC